MKHGRREGGMTCRKDSQQDSNQGQFWGMHCNHSTTKMLPWSFSLSKWQKHLSDGLWYLLRLTHANGSGRVPPTLTALAYSFAASVRPKQKQMSLSCQLCVYMCMCRVCMCVSVYYMEAHLGCGSFSSSAAAVTWYSTHTFLLLIQACLLAMISVQFNLS